MTMRAARRSAAALAVLVLLLPLGSCGGEAPRFHAPAMIVLGFDGLDPNLLDRWMAEGRMPNFKRLAEEGGYSRLGTSLPPESPVAWANFITGLDPGGHGVFDFVQRHATERGIQLYLGSAETIPPSDFLSIGGYRIPRSSGGMRNLVRGKFLWQRLVEAGVPCSVVRIPDNFPPMGFGARTISGMGTPDLLGTMGVFSYYTEVKPENLDDFAGKGEVTVVRAEDGVIRTKLLGPENSFVEPDPKSRRSPRAEVDLVIYPDRERRAARIDLGEETRILAVGEWSGWVPVSFELVPVLASASGMVRFFLKDLEPLRLYVSPVNIDPRDPALPVGTPDDASVELAAAIGPYATKGMAEETHGARTGVLDTEDFIEQSAQVLAERRRMLDFELARFRERGGFSFFYFSTTDLCAHILWRLTDPEHPFHDEADAQRHGERLREIYEEMDDVLGQVMAEAPEGARILVMSDHGFAPLRRKVSLNTWLAENGYLAIRYPDRRGKLDGYRNVDWFETRAYNVGFCGIFLNLVGREAQGYVEKGEAAEALKAEIAGKLEALVDPKTGERVVTKVYRREDVYRGEALQDAPDLVVGFARGYENMDESVTGDVPVDLFEDNLDAWSGSHLMDPSHVPGVVLSNRPIRLGDPELRDLTTSILAVFGVSAPELPGRDIHK